MHRPANNKADLMGSPMCPPSPLLMDPLSLEALNNHDNQPALGATKAGGGWQESVNKVTTQPQRWATNKQ
jgi:hypothetical protein